jgi:hypothetical protein
MTPDAQRIAIAKACGGRIEVGPFDSVIFRTADGRSFGDPLSDRDAAIEAVLTLCSPTAEQREFCEGPQITFCRNLLRATGWNEHAIDGDRAMFAFDAMTASAANICDALLRTLNLWDDSK